MNLQEARKLAQDRANETGHAMAIIETENGYRVDYHAPDTESLFGIKPVEIVKPE